MGIKLASSQPQTESQGLQMVLCVAVAAVWLVEFSRRAGEPRLLLGKQLLRAWAPEVLGLVAVLSLALHLRLSAQDAFQAPSEDEAQAWAEITAAWPLLITADTLLSLQAMLRLLVLALVVFRVSDVKSFPLGGSAAFLWFAAGLSRAAVPFFSDVYMLDGPLGGKPPQLCELAVLPLLLVLCWRSRSFSFLPCLLVVLAAAVAAYWNRLALSGSVTPDVLFILAHILDQLVAFAYLLRTLLMDCSDSLSLTHLIMAAQAAMCAYFFVAGFPHDARLVAAGSPFGVLHIGSTAQLGAYLAAASLHIAQWAEP